MKTILISIDYPIIQWISIFIRQNKNYRIVGMCIYKSEKKKIAFLENKYFKIYCFEEITEKINFKYKRSIKIDKKFMRANLSYADFLLANNYRDKFLKNKIAINIFQQKLNFFYKKIFLEKPKVIFHEHAGGLFTHGLEKIAKSKNIRYLLLKNYYFSGMFLFFDFLKKTPIGKKKNKIELSKFFDFQKNKKLSPLQVQSYKFNKKRDENIKQNKNYDIYNWHPKNNFSEKVINKFLNYLRNLYLDIFESKKIEENYVVFFLSVEPELNSYALSKNISSNLNIILKLRKNLPKNIKILVKEHYIMKKRSLRSIKFYQQIKQINNVKLISTKINNFELIKNSIFVVSKSGTVLFESFLQNKFSICFGDLALGNINGIFQIKKSKDIKIAIKKILKKKKIFQNLKFHFHEFRKAYSYMYNGSPIDYLHTSSQKKETVQSFNDFLKNYL